MWAGIIGGTFYTIHKYYKEWEAYEKKKEKRYEEVQQQQTSSNTANVGREKAREEAKAQAEIAKTEVMGTFCTVAAAVIRACAVSQAAKRRKQKEDQLRQQVFSPVHDSVATAAVSCEWLHPQEEARLEKEANAREVGTWAAVHRC